MLIRLRKSITQVLTQPTRISTAFGGVKDLTCIDHTFTHIYEMCLQGVSMTMDAVTLIRLL